MCQQQHFVHNATTSQTTNQRIFSPRETVGFSEIDGSNDCEGFADGTTDTEGNNESDGDSDGLLDNEGTIETDGSLDTVGAVEGVSDDKVGPSVAEGLEEGDGLGLGEPVGDTLGPVVDVGALEEETLGTDDGTGVGAGEPDGPALGRGDTVGKPVGDTPVGEGEGFGETVGVTDGKGVVGLDDGAGLGAGDVVGSNDGVGGTIGAPVVGFAVGEIDTEGTEEGEGDGWGLTLGEDDGSGTVGLGEGAGEGMGLTVGTSVGACVVDGADVVGFAEGDGVPLWARNPDRIPSSNICETRNERDKRPPAVDSSFVIVSVEWVSAAPATARQNSNKGVNPNRIPELMIQLVV